MKIACLFLYLIIIGFGQSVTQAQTIPAKVRTYLNRNYSGWKPTAIASGCYTKFARSIVSGDFDGDGKKDYAVKLVRGTKGYVIAFLARGDDYSAFVLEARSARDIKNYGLSIGRKGERYPIGGDPPDVIYGKLPNDAPFVGPCESDSGGYRIYSNGRFQ